MRLYGKFANSLNYGQFPIDFGFLFFDSKIGSISPIVTKLGRKYDAAVYVLPVYIYVQVLQ